MLPAFATIDDLDDRLPGPISEADEARAQAALDDASALIRAEAAKTWVTEGAVDADAPDILRTVTVRSALRAFVNPSGLQQSTAGPFNASYANASSDVYLTAAEKALVREAAGKSVLTTRSTTRGPIETGSLSDWPVAVEYVAVSPPGKPLPFL